MAQNGGGGGVWPHTQKTKHCSQRGGQDRWSAQTRGSRIRDGTGGDGPLTRTHLHVQRAVLKEPAGVVEAQQHFITAGRQLPRGGEGGQVSCGENRSRFRRTLDPSGKAPTCRVGTDGPVDLMLSEELQGEGPSVARSIRVHHVQLDGRRAPAADTGCPLLDHRTVVILVQEADQQSARACGRDNV